MLKTLTAVALALLIQSSPASAQDCGKALNALMKRTVQAAVTTANICSGLKKEVDYKIGKVTVGVDKTANASVNALEVCLSRSDIDLKGTLDVTCKTSPKAVVPVSISEKIMVSGKVRTSDCGVSEFSLNTSGEIGKAIANLVEPRVKKELDAKLKKLCE